MAIDDNSYDNAQSVNDGLIVDEEGGGPFFTGGSASPVGLDLPVSTLYTQVLASGVILWKHNSTDINDWSPITAEIFGASPPPMVLSHNGTVSNNQLVGYTNLANNPIVVGFRSRLNRVTVSSGNTNPDYSLDFFDGSADGGNNNGFHRHTVVNASPNLSIVSGGPVFEAGDLLGIYYRDEGQNANDLNVGLFFEAVPS